MGTCSLLASIHMLDIPDGQCNPALVTRNVGESSAEARRVFQPRDLQSAQRHECGHVAACVCGSVPGRRRGEGEIQRGLHGHDAGLPGVPSLPSRHTGAHLLLYCSNQNARKMEGAGLVTVMSDDVQFEDRHRWVFFEVAGMI